MPTRRTPLRQPRLPAQDPGGDPGEGRPSRQPEEEGAQGGGRPVAHGTGLCRDRNMADRCINKIKEWRGLVTRYDKTPVSHLAGLHLRGAVIWLRSLT
ncbi:transposase [Streptomyces sp. A2-16]|nr:transposase [Streptomyces sp. A2-16]